MISRLFFIWGRSRKRLLRQSKNLILAKMKHFDLSPSTQELFKYTANFLDDKKELQRNGR